MITSINHITLAVSDLDKSFFFYSEMLKLKPQVRWNRGAYLLAGDDWLCLSLDEKARNSPHPDYTHMAFSVSAKELPLIRSSLLAKGVTEWKENTSEGESFYFLDPDSYKLELHVGDIKSRLASLHDKPYERLEWWV